MEVRHEEQLYDVNLQGQAPSFDLYVTGHSEVGPVNMRKWVPGQSTTARYMLGGTHVYTQEKK